MLCQRRPRHTLPTPSWWRLPGAKSQGDAPGPHAGDGLRAEGDSARRWRRSPPLQRWTCRGPRPQRRDVRLPTLAATTRRARRRERVAGGCTSRGAFLLCRAGLGAGGRYHPRDAKTLRIAELTLGDLLFSACGWIGDEVVAYSQALGRVEVGHLHLHPRRFLAQ